MSRKYVNFTAEKFLYSVHTRGHTDQQHVQYGQRRHTFNDYDGPGHNDRIVASFYGDSDILAGLVHGLLFQVNGRCGFHIGPHHHPDQLQQEPLGQRVLLGVGDGVQHAADKTDQTACQGGHDGQDQGVSDADQISGPVMFPKPAHIIAKLYQFLHAVGLLPILIKVIGRAGETLPG